MAAVPITVIVASVCGMIIVLLYMINSPLISVAGNQLWFAVKLLVLFVIANGLGLLLYRPRTSQLNTIES